MGSTVPLLESTASSHFPEKRSGLRWKEKSGRHSAPQESAHSLHNLLVSPTAMREGPFDLVVLRENGYPFQERMVDGKSVVVAEPRETFRVSLGVHPDAAGNFPAPYINAYLYVDGVYTESVSMTLAGRFPVAREFVGFRKSLVEKATYVFSLPDKHCSNPSDDKIELGTFKVVVHRLEDTGRPSESPNFRPTIPDAKAHKEDVKFYKQASVVTHCGKRIPCSPARSGGNVWECRELLATMTLPYHTAEAITILQEFHADQRFREDLAKAINNSTADVPIDLTEGDAEVEAARVQLKLGRAGSGAAAGAGADSDTAAVWVDIAAAEDGVPDNADEDDEDRRKRQRLNLAVAASSGVIDL